jgi:hypothetical protein
LLIFLFRLFFSFWWILYFWILKSGCCLLLDEIHSYISFINLSITL